MHFTQSELSLGWSNLHEIKTLVFAFPAQTKSATIVKVTHVGHSENLTLLYPPIVILWIAIVCIHSDFPAFSQRVNTRSRNPFSGLTSPGLDIRAIPFEKLVGGVSGVSFSDHPAAIFHYFLGYPAVIFSPLTQCKKRPVIPPRSDFGTILTPPCGIF